MDGGSAIPDVPVALIGWRAWRLDRSADSLEPQLVAPIEGSVWPAGRAMTARCHTVDHEAPAPGCGCGLYGVTDPATMMGLAVGRGLVGCAALWGEVIEGHRGWRASHAYPQVLVADPALGSRALARLADRYAVPVHVSPMPLPDLVPLMGTVLRAETEALRVDPTSETAWSTLAAAIAERVDGTAPRRVVVKQVAARRPPRRWRLFGPSPSSGS